jgi:hypothetical protein
MQVVFENTKQIVSPRTGEVAEYITATETGLPVECEEGDNRFFNVLSGYGTPVPVPDGLETTSWPPGVA